MPSASIVAQATAQARRTVALAFVGAAVIVALMIAERTASQYDYAMARQEVTAANRAAGDVLLADERLTISAHMAAATGEARWIARYQETLPLIDDAIARALALAPDDLAATFDAETRAANDALVALETLAFDAVAAGDLEGARAILNGPEYLAHKETLARGADRLLSGVLMTVQARLRACDIRGGLALALAGFAAIIGGLWLWRGLNRSLRSSAEALSEAESKIHTLAKTDVLTGMSNRRALVDACPSSGFLRQASG